MSAPGMSGLRVSICLSRRTNEKGLHGSIRQLPQSLSIRCPSVVVAAHVFRSMIKIVSVHASGQGLHEFTDQLASVVREAGVQQGLCTLFIQHTSASLVIQENADPAVRQDLEHWLNRLVKEDDPHYTHTVEGPDDMPAHIKSVLTSTSVSIPILNGCLALGTWQGIYLWEHRYHRGNRQIIVHIGA
jgi:secondary thiamine-phosphate synthase enzyme